MSRFNLAALATPQRGNFARLTPVGGAVAFESTYDGGLVAAFKAAIPHTARSWDKDGKRWLVDPAYADVCAKLAGQYLGITPTVPLTLTGPTQTETRILTVEYIGRCKDRDGGESSAFAYVDGSWSAVFPESTLRDWFELIPQAPGEAKTLYGVLLVAAAATEDEIRSAFRRLARHWHPDLCQEDGAVEQFKAIKRAYDVLADTRTRRRYDAGLALEASTRSQEPAHLRPGIAYAGSYTDGYRPPLRCGSVLVEGTPKLGRFVVSKVLAWEDVVDAQGRVMVSSWKAGATSHVVEWR